MPSSRASIRLFVGVYPPQPVARALLGEIETRDLTPHRPVPADQVHLTLQFIGETPVKRLPEVVESVERSASGLGGFSLTPGRLIVLPEEGPPRLVAVETDAPPVLLELHERLARRLARRPRAKASDRFLPHLTLCRFPQHERPEELDPMVLAGAAMPGAFGVDEIVLVKSVLRPQGASHEAVARVPLGR